MGLRARVRCTLELALYALLPANGQATARGGEAAAKAGEMSRCTPRQIRGGLQRFLDPRGQLSIFFPGCLAIGAAFVLFRMKREGFSNCSVQASQEGLYVRGRR